MTTRRKPASKIDEPEVDESHLDSADQVFLPITQQVGPQGCMMPIMFAMMLGMFGFLIWDRAQPPAVSPVFPPSPVVNPPVDLTSFTFPITTKLANDKTKAGQVESAYIGLRDAIAGASGARVTNSRVFESVSRAFLTDLNAKGGVDVGSEIDNAIGAYLGMSKSVDPKDPGWEPMQFDQAKRSRLVEILGAIAAGAGSVK